MTDFFILLGETRRPWVDVERLKARFLEISAGAHPDRFHATSEDEAGIGRAAVCRSQRGVPGFARAAVAPVAPARVGTWREAQGHPAIAAGHHGSVRGGGAGLPDVDGFLEKRRAVTSPMLKVRLFAQGLEWTEKLQALQGKINARGGELDAELQQMNAAWATVSSEGTARLEGLPLARLEEIYRVMSYVARWTEQVQERSVQLASY